MENLGKNIKKKRIKKGWNQAQLADFLGVSPQAVSKWERGENLPDIISLIDLGRLLETSIDKLVDFNLEISEEDQNILVEKAVDIFVDKGFQEGYLYTEKILKDHPSSIGLKFKLGGLFQNFIIKEKLDLKDQLPYYEKAIEYYQEVEETGVEKYIYKSRLKLLGYYTLIGKLDEAEKILEKIGEENPDKDFLLGNLYIQREKKEEGAYLYKSFLEKNVTKLLATLNILASLEGEKDLEKAEEIFKIAESISKIFGINEEIQRLYCIQLMVEKGEYEKASQAYYKLAKELKEKDFKKRNLKLLNGYKEEEDLEELKKLLAAIVLQIKGLEEIENYKDYRLGRLILENITK